MRITSAAGKTRDAGSQLGSQTTELLKPRRELGLDIWRGFAVALMIITHAIAFFHVGDDPVISSIGIFGGLVSFTMFLFLSGASAYFSYIKYDGATHSDQINMRRGKLVYRTIILLLGYYVVAMVSSIPLLEFPPTNQTWSTITGILTLQVTPPFTEFILAFFLFNILLLVARPVIRLLTNFPLFGLITGLALYLAGTLLWQVQLDEPFASYKALIAGDGDRHTFPIMQFSLVYILGASWGRFLVLHGSAKLRKKITTYVLILTAALVFAGIMSFGYLEFTWLDPLLRFPPSVSLIAIGLLSGYAIWQILLVTGNAKFLGPIQVFLHYMGTKAFEFFVFHTIILFAYKYLTGDQHHESSIVVIALYLLLLTATFIVTAIWDNVIENLKSESKSTSEFGWLISERVVVNLVWSVVAVLVGLTLFQGQVSATTINPEDVSFKKRLLREEEWPFWWDHSFDTFRQITINNPGVFPVGRGTWYQLNLNHGELVSQGRSKASGGDVRMVYYNEQEGYFNEIPFRFNGIGGSATLVFSLQENINPAEEDDKYFVYFGQPELDSLTPAQDAPEQGQTEGLSASADFRHRLRGQVNRKWHLKEGFSALQLRTMRYTISLDENLSAESIVTFNVVGTNIRGSMDNLGGRRYEGNVPIGNLEPGIYKVQAIAREPQDKLRLISSDQTTFFVTYPLYVVWTQDWEGWDVPEDWLVGLDVMAQKYNLPMTHFFNPHIYTFSGIDRNRADRLTLWAQDRAKNFNDEIGLHLHMWTDMVRASGVNPRYGPAAPWLYGDGGGVLASAYTKDEMKQILNWSRRIFQENGLLPPISFRAGGWFTEEHTLQALAETGFLIDSSGRTFPTDPKQVAYPPPWNLTPTTRPYKPNVNDMNSEAAPHINIWEFPNNGADSYWYAAQDLIDRFDINYPNKGQILKAPQVLNYLSHPQFFRVWNKGGTDETKMTAVFDHIKNYLYASDLGPAVYTTLENSYYGYTPWATQQTVINP